MNSVQRQRTKRAETAGWLLALGVALASCSTSSLFDSSSPSGGSSTGSSTSLSDQMAAAGSPAKPSDNAATPPDVIDCPVVDVRSGAATLLIGGKPGEPSPLDLRYQGIIVRVARECATRAGMMALKVGIEGRIILGPVGGPGHIDVPLRIALVHEGPEPKTILSKLARIPVTIPENVSYVNFIHVDPDITFPLPKSAPDIEQYVVYVGFDAIGANEPKPKKPKAAPKTAAKKPRLQP